MKINVISLHLWYQFRHQSISIQNRVKIIIYFMVLIYRRTYRFLFRAIKHILTVLPIVIIEFALCGIIFIEGKNLSWFSTVDQMIKYLLPFILSTIVISYFISFISDQSDRNKDLNMQRQLYWLLYYSLRDYLQLMDEIFGTDLSNSTNIQKMKMALLNTNITKEFWNQEISVTRYQSCTNKIMLLNLTISRLETCLNDTLEKSLFITNKDIQILMFKNIPNAINYYTTGDFDWSYFGDYHNKEFMSYLLIDELYSTTIKVLKELHTPWDIDTEIDDKIIKLSCR